MHMHMLAKGLSDDVTVLEAVVRAPWERWTGAHRVGVAELIVPGAAIHYLNLHHRKAAQAPPADWRGMIERSSRGYWSEPVKELRERAVVELRAEAIAYNTGLDFGDSFLIAQGESEARKERASEREALRAALVDLTRDARIVQRVPDCGTEKDQLQLI